MFVFAALIRGHYKYESSDCFVYPKKSLLKSGHTKKYLPNFPTQKNPGIENVKPQIILGSSPSLEIRRIARNPPPPPPRVVSTVEGEWDGNSELLDH